MSTGQSANTFLHQKFLELNAKNPGFTKRAFSKKLGISSGALSEILSGKRKISRKMANKLALSLGLDPSEKSQFMQSFNSGVDQIGPELKTLKLKSDEFAVIADWIHFAILSLLKTKDFCSDPEWMAMRLGVTSPHVRKALNRLLQFSLIEITPTGEYQRTSQYVHTTDGIVDLSIRKSHLSDMEMAKEKIQSIPTSMRDFSAITLPLDRTKIAEVKEILRETQDRITRLMEDGECSEVYKLTHYFYPLTHIGDNNDS